MKENNEKIYQNETLNLKQIRLSHFTEQSKLTHVFYTLIFCLSLIFMSLKIKSLDFIEDKFRYAFYYLEILAVFVIYNFTTSPNYQGILRIIFKFVQSAAIVYLMNIIFMLLLDHETVRHLLVLVDPSLNEKIVGRDYSIDCAFYTPNDPNSNFANFRNTLDVFVSAHFFGWLVKCLIFRNNILCWTMSIGFEILELSLNHLLPNFHECWWDHLLLDLFGMNLLGIIIGNLIISKFNIPRFHWFFEPNEESQQLNYFQRFIYTFTSVRKYVSEQKWHFLASPGNFLTVVYVCANCCLTDLSNFFNKSVLNIPADHWLLGFRIFIVGFLAMISVTEIYEFTRKKYSEKIVTTNIILSNFIILTEILLFLKNYPDGFFEKSASPFIHYIWYTISGVLFTMFIFACYNQRKKMVKNQLIFYYFQIYQKFIQKKIIYQIF